MTVILQAEAGLVLRPWRREDAGSLLEAYRDPGLRRWLRTLVDSDEDALRWLDEQRRGWESGRRLSFAVFERAAGDDGPGESGDREPPGLVAHVVLKDLLRGGPSAEVGYWTVAAARGRGVASRALNALTDWVFAEFAADGLERLELLHQVDNHASCRVAQKSGYELEGVVPPQPPYPAAGHLHICRAER